MPKLLIAPLIISLFLGEQLFAQQTQNLKITRKTVYFLKNDGRYVTERDSADYIRIVSEPDSGSNLYNFEEYYKDNKRKFIGKSSKSDFLSPEGLCLSFYQSGKRASAENYKHGNLDSICYYFYPNGKLYLVKYYLQIPAQGENIGSMNSNFLVKYCLDSLGNTLVKEGYGYYKGYDSRFKYIEEEGPVKDGQRDSTWKGRDAGMKIQFTEEYIKGKLTSGISTDSAGVKHPYSERAVPPRYKGGMTALYHYLGSHIRYPYEAQKNNIQGTVILNFVVKKDGTVKDVKVMRPVEKDIDDEAVRVVSRSEGWEPGMYYGIPVNVRFSLPVAFSLQE